MIPYQCELPLDIIIHYNNCSSLIYQLADIEMVNFKWLSYHCDMIIILTISLVMVADTEGIVTNWQFNHLSVFVYL